MSDSRWERVKEIVGEALERPPSERKAFVDEACAADPSLREEVDSLLGHERKSFLQRSFPAIEGELLERPPGLAPGARLGPYEIRAPIGSGGMGEVYRGRHVKLGRDAAIKILPRELTSDPERLDRFEREARAASSINHPTIVTIYDIGEEETTPYIAMELVEGKTLRELIGAGPLPKKELLPLAVQIAEGLAKAHEAGIVHRDLKPENVMVTKDGLAKILDFGLAKLMPRDVEKDSQVDTVTKATRAGTILGTVQYMSPEQAAGRPVDSRTDQFSFGAILYEMATGRRAFQKETTAETLAAIIEGEPEPLRKLEPRIPERLTAIVERCLAKSVRERYESTSDLARELKSVPETARSWPARRRVLWAAVGLFGVSLALTAGVNMDRLRSSLTPGMSASPIESIAVLPFTNTSGEPEQEYFADGMTEVLITDLAKIGTLKVISRTSAMRYKETNKSPSEIAQELDVQAIVEGSALRSGDRVRVAAQLIDVETEELLWAETYQRDFQDLLRLQSELARAVVDEIQVALSPEDSARLARAREVNPEAYETYLKGRFHLNKYTPPDIELALSYFEMALDTDPDFALAHVGIADVWGVRNQLGFTPPREALPEWRAAVQRALELDDSLAEAQAALAALKTWGEWDWPAAERAWTRAIELNPNDAVVRTSYSHYLHQLMRPDEAMAQIERALELDPFNNFTLALYGVDLFFARRYAEAVEQFRESLRASPGNPISLGNLAATLHVQGRYEGSLDAQRAYLAAIGDRESEQALERGFAAKGYEGAMRELAGIAAARSRNTGTNGVDVARLYVRAGENEEALDWLERAFEERDPNMAAIGVAPDLDPIRDHPRFRELLRRMNLPL